MKITVAAVLSCFVLTALLWAQPASAAAAKKVAGESKLVAAKTLPTELGKPPDVGPPQVPPTTKPVKPPKPPKPDRSKKNPDDPDDHDQGHGNDDKDQHDNGKGNDDKNEQKPD